MRYCPSCGGGLALRRPDGDERDRHVCDACGTIHYVNPKVVVGAVCTLGDRLLICRRAIEPRAGFWTIPAGFLELGESAEEGASREAWEEARARIRIEAYAAAFLVAEPALATSPDRRARLGAAIEELIEAGAITASRAVDRSELPALPRFIVPLDRVTDPPVGREADERLEGARELLGVEAGTVVAHDDPHHRVPALPDEAVGGDVDGAAAGAVVVDGVAHEVGQDLAYGGRVGPHGHGGVDVDGHLDRSGGGGREVPVHDVGDGVGHPDLGAAVVEVADNGVGMRAEDRDKIFMPFFTTKPTGTGLGMAIVKKIMDLHAGEIEIDSVPGAGTTVRLVLPEASVTAPAGVS